MLLGIVAATALLRGYWNIDHEVSLSPLETGCALAPVIMSNPAKDRGANIEELLRLIGKKRV
jgi:hypothetical protein